MAGHYQTPPFYTTAVLGAFTFWILVPAGKEITAAIEERGESS